MRSESIFISYAGPVSRGRSGSFLPAKTLAVTEAKCQSETGGGGGGQEGNIEKKASFWDTFSSGGGKVGACATGWQGELCYYLGKGGGGIAVPRKLIKLLRKG